MFDGFMFPYFHDLLLRIDVELFYYLPYFVPFSRNRVKTEGIRELCLLKNLLGIMCISMRISASPTSSSSTISPLVTA